MVPWKCPNCGTTFQYHPMPCPLCGAEKAKKEIDMSGIREAATGIQTKAKKEEKAVDLGEVASVKRRKK